MSHPEQIGFFSLVASSNTQLISGAKILEIGSYDVNGTIRSLFGSAAEYVGVDLTPGPGVDIVGYGHEVDHPDGSFDATISGECFEHDPHWRETFGNMVRLTRAGGIVAFTCASRGRPEHGTRRTDAALSPGTQAVGLDYYRNLESGDFDELPLGEWFSEWRFWYLPTSFDLYFMGIRHGGGPEGSVVLPSDADVARLSEIMPVSHRLARMPLRALSRFLTGKSYQRFAVPYWQTLLRLSGDRAVRQQAP